jgi:hypothetical protein
MTFSKQKTEIGFCLLCIIHQSYFQYIFLAKTSQKGENTTSLPLIPLKYRTVASHVFVVCNARTIVF